MLWIGIWISWLPYAFAHEPLRIIINLFTLCFEFSMSQLIRLLIILVIMEQISQVFNILGNWLFRSGHIHWIIIIIRWTIWVAATSWLAINFILWRKDHLGSCLALDYTVLWVFNCPMIWNVVVVNFYRLRVLDGLLIIILLALGSLIIILLTLGSLVMISDVVIDLFYIDLVLIVLRSLSIIFCHFLSVFTLLLCVIESTDLRLIATWTITVDSLILIRVIEPFHSSVALAA